MPKIKKAVKATRQKLSPEQRSQIAKDRWAKRRANATEKTDEIIAVTWPESNVFVTTSKEPITSSSSVVITQQEMPIEEAKALFGRDQNGVPPVVGLGDGTITPSGAFVPDVPVLPPAPQSAPVRVRKQKRTPVPKEFSAALRTADQLLAKAIAEYEDCDARIEHLKKAIPRLQRTYLALRSESDPDALTSPPPAPYNFSGSVPNATAFQAPIQQFPNPLAAYQAAQVAPPVSRAQGGAIQFGPDVVGALEGPEDDEDQFLKGPNAGSGWIGG
jgi:hypothetical protein